MTDQLDIETWLEKQPKFAGAVYSPAFDDARLTGQIGRVFDCVKDGRWRSLDEIATIPGDPHASVSAQMRHLRNPRFGGWIVEKRARGARPHGLFEYSLRPASSASV